MRKKKKTQQDIEEMSAMGAGSVAGSPASDKDEETNDETILREIVRNIIKNTITQRLVVEEKEENQLRQLVRKLIHESKKDVEKVPHSSTAINLLEDLLKSILPNLEAEYKTLTTSSDQRESFRKHIVNAVSTLLETENVNKEGGEAAAEEKLISLDEEDIEEDVAIQVSDVENTADQKFIDIEPPDFEQPEEDEESFEILGQDATGRALAKDAFNNIEKNIAETYAILHDEEDEKLFEDYLVTNLKLYFDKWERELGPVTEPTTDEYEAEKDADEAGAEAGAEFDTELGGDLSAAGSGEEFV